MRLIMKYSATDGATYDFEVLHPFIYDSAEQALVDFEALVIAHKTSSEEFKFAGIRDTFYGCDFYDFDGNLELPTFLTVDEWFADAEKK